MSRLLVLSFLPFIVASALATVEDAPVRAVGKFTVSRSGDQMSYALTDRSGRLDRVQVPSEVIASQNGLQQIEGAWVVAYGHTSRSLFQAKKLEIVTPQSLEYMDPLIRLNLPSAAELLQARVGFKGKVDSFYTAMKAGQVGTSRIQSLLGGPAKAIALVSHSSQRGSLGARLFIGGDARHYYLVSHSGLSAGSNSGVQIEEVVEDQTEDIGNGILLDRSHRLVMNGSSPVWLAGQKFRDPYVGEVRVDAVTPLGAAVTVRPFTTATDVFVTNTLDSGAGSLRNALQIQQADPGFNVKFNIPISDAGFVGGAWTIKILGALPTLARSGSRLDGVSQRQNVGDTNHIGPEIFIDQTGITSGFKITGSNCLIREIGFINSAGPGLDIAGDGNRVQRCFIGIGIDGLKANPNVDGVRLEAATNTQIGFDSLNGNLISGNSFNGIKIVSGSQNRIEGNKIGTNALGLLAVPNVHGVSFLAGADQNSVGSALPLHGNIISGNGFNGITILSSGVTVVGNRIGTSANGLSAIPNLIGISVSNGSFNQIGDPASGGLNIIAGNSRQGIKISGAAASNNRVVSNRLGVSVNNTAIPNATGILLINGAHDSKIGGVLAGEGNVISANAVDGITVSDGNANLIQGNRIGTNVNGTAAAGNGGAGVKITKGFKNFVGGIGAGEANLISGNRAGAVTVNGTSSTDNSIVGNIIGSNVDQSATIPNFQGIFIGAGCPRHTVAHNIVVGNDGPGIIDAGTLTVIQSNSVGIAGTGQVQRNLSNGIEILSTSTQALVGGNVGQGNVIAGNTGVGLLMSGSRTRVFGNSIGVDANKQVVSNTLDAIKIFDGGFQNQIGAVGLGNYIAGRFGRDAITISGSTTIKNFIRCNKYFTDFGLNVNLFSAADPTDHVTPNDPLDSDLGSNELQNAPLLKTVTLSGTQMIVNGQISSKANTTYNIDLYAVFNSNSAAHGGVVTFIGTVAATTGASGVGSFTTNLDRPKGALSLCAAAVDPLGNTSEMSLNRLIPLL